MELPAPVGNCHLVTWYLGLSPLCLARATPWDQNAFVLPWQGHMAGAFSVAVLPNVLSEKEVKLSMDVLSQLSTKISQCA